MKMILPFAGFALFAATSMASPVVLDPDLGIRKIMDTGAGSMRLAWNPEDGHLYYLKQAGPLYRVDLLPSPAGSTSTMAYGSTDHQVASAAGLAIGSDGTIYLSSNRNVSNHTVSVVTKGVKHPATGLRTWSVLAQTAPYESQSRLFNHQMNALVLSPDGQSIFVNLGARTDHGEIQADGTRFPGVRETGLTTLILQLPAGSTGLVLPNDREQLRAMGYLYCEGVRNTYDLAFAANGDLFGVENGPDRDMPEELNWLRKGHHYGFPWRMGTEDNPQQFAFYDPVGDGLLNAGYAAVQQGTYRNDPTFPPPPPSVTFTDPIMNTGPDADRFRDPLTGAIMDASDHGLAMGTFTAHRSPLGLCFDTRAAMGSHYQGDAFVLSWTAGLAAGQPGTGPFDDLSEDLLHLQLTPTGPGYQVAATSVVTGFRNPVASAIVNNKLYILENGGTQSLWEVTFPAAPLPLLDGPRWLVNGDLQITVHGEQGQSYVLESSPDLAVWAPVHFYAGSGTPLTLTLPVANKSRLFYRARLRDGEDGEGKS